MNGTRPRSGRSSPACVTRAGSPRRRARRCLTARPASTSTSRTWAGGCPTCGVADRRQHLRGVRRAQLLRRPGRPAADQWQRHAAGGHHHPVHAAAARTAGRGAGAPPRRPGPGPAARAGPPGVPPRAAGRGAQPPVRVGRAAHRDRRCPARSSGSGSTWPSASSTASSGWAASWARTGGPSAPQDDWKIVHFLGYDNTFYHSILGPALYKLANPEWTPDVDYNVNEFYLLDGASSPPAAGTRSGARTSSARTPWTASASTWR